MDTALVLRAALTRGRRDATATAAGIVAGLFVWGAAAAVGVSALLTASQVAYDVLRSGDWLYWSAPAAARTGGPGRPPPRRAPLAGGPAGLATNLLNPKVGVFYVALLPQFLPAGADPLAVGLLLAGVHALSRWSGSPC